MFPFFTDQLNDELVALGDTVTYTTYPGVDHGEITVGGGGRGAGVHGERCRRADNERAVSRGSRTRVSRAGSRRRSRKVRALRLDRFDRVTDRRGGDLRVDPGIAAALFPRTLIAAA